MAGFGFRRNVQNFNDATYNFNQLYWLLQGNLDSDNTVLPGNIGFTPEGLIGRNALGEATFHLDADGNVALVGNITMLGGEIVWADVTAPSYTQITGTKPPTNADNTDTLLLGNGFTKIGANYIYTNTIAAEQIITGNFLSLNSMTLGVLNDNTPKYFWFHGGGLGESYIKSQIGVAGQSVLTVYTGAFDVHALGNVFIHAGDYIYFDCSIVLIRGNTVWHNDNAPTSTGSTTVAAHNHGIPNGTKLAVDGGGSVTWVAYGGASHSHTIPSA